MQIYGKCASATAKQVISPNLQSKQDQNSPLLYG